MRKSSFALFIVLGLFAARFPVGAQTTELFEPYQALFDVGSWPEAVAIGDVNGDGRSDVVMTTSFYFDESNDYKLFVFLQDETGALVASAPPSYPTSGSYTSRPESVDIGDVTGDGLDDVVVGLDDAGIEVFPQLPDGTLGASILYPTADAYKIRLGDLNNDGRLDVAAIGWGTDTATVFTQNSAGTFDGPMVYVVNHSGYEDLEVGDVTGDGLTDIVVMSGQLYATPNIGVLAQQFAGGFDAPAYYSVGQNILTSGVGVGDANGDGLNDVVVSYGGNQPASHVGVFAQNANGTLDAVVSYPAYDIPEPVEVADLDLDGRADVATAHGGWQTLGVFRQSDSGTLAAEELHTIPYASHYNPHGLDVGDINGDRSPDVVIADYNSGLIVLYNTTVAPPEPEPALTDLSVDLERSAKRIKRKRSFSFLATAYNNGPDNSAGLSLTVSVTGPHGTLTVSDPDCGVNGDQVSCTFDSLAAGAARGVLISGVGTAKGRLTATASVTGVDIDNYPDNDSDFSTIRVR
jgi:hypothetical protein